MQPAISLRNRARVFWKPIQRVAVHQKGGGEGGGGYIFVNHA